MSLLDPSEQTVIDRLSEAWNAFLALQPLHPDEQTEFRHAIHAAQAIVMARPVQREFNGRDERDTPEYQEYLAECAKHCRCTHSVCEGVLAGGLCDEIIEDDSDEDRCDRKDDDE